VFRKNDWKQQNAEKKGGNDMRVTVDEETCIGCGLCAETCPDVFELKDDKAYAKMDEVPEAFADACREAAEECPVEAIQID
jgi:ferredoxin